MLSGLWHLHIRKRISSTLHAPYPHPDKWMRLLDRIILLVAVIAPMSNIPQLLKIYVEQNPTGVSPITFGMYIVFNVPWITYGIVHKEKPIIISSSIWAVTNIAILLGVLVYG